ncbi:hypothetical protein J0H58_35310, partial [bacterium]|nr:hypothetical protein [bacterium]
DRADPRADYLRAAVALDRVRAAGGTDPDLARRLADLGAGLDPGWVTVVADLAQPFRADWNGNAIFECPLDDLPLRAAVGLRGRVATFEGLPRVWDAGLAADLAVLGALPEETYCYGADKCQVHPFLADFDPTGRPDTAADVLRALGARDFASRYIDNLDVTRIDYPGYHPREEGGRPNDEIHNTFAAQYVFQHEQYVFQRDQDETGEPLSEDAGTHGVLKRAVVGGQLWYVLLHPRPHPYGGYLLSRYVMLFAVGRSLVGDRLIGVVTSQMCRNLCD